MFLKIDVLKSFANFTGKQLSLYFFLIRLKALTLNPVFSSETSEIFKKPFPTVHYSTLRVAAF